MSWGRIAGTVTAVLAVAACALVALGMARPQRTVRPDQAAPVALTGSQAPVWPTPTRRLALATHRARPVRTHPTSLSASAAPLSTSAAVVPVVPSRTASSTAAPATHHAVARTAAPSDATTTAATAPTTAARTTASPSPSRASRRTSPAVPARHRPVRHGRRLPLAFRTHHARQVITVVASRRRTTTATLQAWRRAPGGGWRRRGPRITAWIGAQGMTHHASESRSATPIGSFTLTHAFGHDSDPGTALPYLHTTPADWWISQSGPLYNSHQRCSSNCSFTQGDPNEHLYYETPYYDYAVVIDYNTRNAPGGVQQGKGSAFFLHVTVHQPTAGCVAIPQARLVSILRWLRPGKHPRILIGVHR